MDCLDGAVVELLLFVVVCGICAFPASSVDISAFPILCMLPSIAQSEGSPFNYLGSLGYPLQLRRDTVQDARFRSPTHARQPSGHADQARLVRVFAHTLGALVRRETRLLPPGLTGINRLPAGLKAVDPATSYPKIK